MTTKSMSTEGGPVIVHQAFIPLEGPIRSLCGADGRSVLRTADVTCPDCLTAIELGTWRTVFDDEDATPVEAVHKILIPHGGDARALCGAVSGPAAIRSEGVTCPGCRNEAERHDAAAADCPAWCDRFGHTYTGPDFHHTGSRRLGGVSVVLAQWPGAEVKVSVSVLDDEPLSTSDAKRLSYALADPERAVAETAHCPAWCDGEESHRIPGLDADHMNRVRAVDLSAYAGDEESMGYLALYLHQGADETEPVVLLDGPDERTEVRLTLAEAEELHAALGELLAVARG